YRPQPFLSTPAPQTGSSVRITAASLCAGSVTETTTVATMRTSPTPPALVRTALCRLFTSRGRLVPAGGESKDRGRSGTLLHSPVFC
uniref:Uncharacterized protein n=1 Tax=Periophthalmus magnuspinnatus TaxID=409849 RepID=A0A3B3ZAQ5_9GOBI